MVFLPGANGSHHSSIPVIYTIFISNSHRPHLSCRPSSQNRFIICLWMVDPSRPCWIKLWSRESECFRGSFCGGVFGLIWRPGALSKQRKRYPMCCSQQLLHGQDAKDRRHQDYINALRSEYLTHGISRREMRPIKKRVRTTFFRCPVWPESELSFGHGGKWRLSAP